MIDAITITPSETGISSLGFQHLPLMVACAIMLVAAFINYFTLTTPNWLSLSGILTAWVVALLLSIEIIELTDGSVPSALVSMVLGGVLLIPFYITGWLGAGCVKMQAAYGAWLGCAYPIAKSAILVGVTTIAGALLTTVAALVVWLFQRSCRPDSQQTILFPAQVTLSLSSLLSLAVWWKLMG